MKKILTGLPNDDRGYDLSAEQYQLFVQTYIMPMFIKDVPDSVLDPMDGNPQTLAIDDIAKIRQIGAKYDEQNAILLRRIRRTDSPCYSIQLKSNNAEAYLYIECDTDGDHTKCTTFNTRILRLNRKLQVGDFRALKVRIDGNMTKVSNIHKGAIYYGANRELVAREYEMLDLAGLVHYSIIVIIGEALNAIHQFVKNGTEMSFPVHSPLYMEIAESFRETYEHSFERLESFFNAKELPIPNFCFHLPLEGEEEHPLMDFRSNDSLRYPLVNLTPRELEWIHKYAFPIMTSKDEPYKHYIEAITKCRFGNTLRVLQPMVDSDEERELTVNFSHEGNITRFMVTERLRPGIGVLAVMVYTDDANLPFNFDFLKISLVLNKGVPMPRDHSILDESALASGGSKFVMLVCFQMLELLVAAHDRPKKYTTLKQYKPREKSNRHKNKEPEVICHILQTEVKARKQISEARVRGEDVERNYVIPEWKRSQHVRHYKDGRVVSVQASICRRKKPLATGANVKIKL